MHTFPRLAVSLWVVATLSATACTRDPSPGTEKAAADGERIMRQMSDTLARARVLRFATAESLETPGLPSERHVLHFTRSVTVRRPDAMRFELKGTEGTSLDLAASYAGGRSPSATTCTGCGRRPPCPRRSTQCSTTSPGASRFRCRSPTWSTACRTRRSSARAREAGSSAARRSAASRVRASRTPTTTWVSSCGFPPRARPCRGAWSSLYKRVPGAPKARMDFTRWDLAPAGDGRTFAFQPRADAATIPIEQLAAFQLSPGRYASARASHGAAVMRDPVHPWREDR